MTRESSDEARLAEALAAAARWHRGQRRKSSDSPYLSHLLQVAGLVLEHGGTPDQAVAALLHDAVEDTAATLSEIEAAFGPEVTAIVAGCSDILPGDRPEAKSPWAQRKAHYVEQLRTASDEVALVAACDKLHNLRSLVAEVRRHGRDAISPPAFNADPAAQLAYHQDVLDAVGDRVPPELRDELTSLVSELGAHLG